MIVAGGDRSGRGGELVAAGVGRGRVDGAVVTEAGLFICATVVALFAKLCQ